MPKMPRGKVGVYVYIDKELYEKLRTLVKAKYPYLRGGLSKEVEEALAYWIRLHTHRHTKKFVVERMNPQPKVFQVFEQVKDYLKRKYMFLPQQVTWRDLEEAISAVRGSDRRTIRKWITELLKWKLVKPIAPQVYEIV